MSHDSFQALRNSHYLTCSVFWNMKMIPHCCVPTSVSGLSFSLSATISQSLLTLQSPTCKAKLVEEPAKGLLQMVLLFRRYVAQCLLVDINLLLTQPTGCTEEYWVEVEAESKSKYHYVGKIVGRHHANSKYK